MPNLCTLYLAGWCDLNSECDSGAACGSDGDTAGTDGYVGATITCYCNCEIMSSNWRAWLDGSCGYCKKGCLMNWIYNGGWICPGC